MLKRPKEFTDSDCSYVVVGFPVYDKFLNFSMQMISLYFWQIFISKLKESFCRN